MTTPPTQLQPPPTKTVRKLIVEVADGRDFLPKDGQGSSSPYIVAEFDGQRKRTSTKFRDLNPVWNEQLEFIVSDPEHLDHEELEIEVYNDKKMSSSNGRKNHFLGRVKLYGSQFAKKSDDVGLIYYQLEKKSVFSWIRGEIGLRIYSYDEIVEEDQINKEDPPPQPPLTDPAPPSQRYPPGVVVVEEGRVFEVPSHVEPVAVHDGCHSPPVVVIEESPPPIPQESNPVPVAEEVYYHHRHPIAEVQYPMATEVRKMQVPPPRNVGEMRPKVLKRANGGGEFSPKVISGKFRTETDNKLVPPYGLVEPMQYLYVKILKARGITAPNESPYVRVRTTNHLEKTKPASHRPGEPTDSPEWNQVFALPHDKNESNSGSAELEISVWDSPSDQFLGGVCFNLADVSDSPLAPTWYRLEGSPEDQGKINGDIQLSVWLGTQADDAFRESWSSDAPHVSHTRSKIYQSPKMWYLRVTVIEAQDVSMNNNMPPPHVAEIRVKVQLGFQSVRTRKGSVSGHTSSFSWNEDVVFVASEPLEDQLILLIEDRTVGKDPTHLGHAVIPVASIEQRLDERHVPAKWYPLEGMGMGPSGPGGEGGAPGGPSYCGRIHLRLCLESGYHVLDEAAHVCSDFRPTAKQLWKPAVGILELGILGARGLLPMKSKGPGKGSTDAYCVAKYGKKWVRTRTISDSFDPRWNEQYTWQVYDPCTVLTVGVFDNWRMFPADGPEEKPDYRIGKVRIRVSTLESNKVYTNSYPLLVLLRNGMKKMGEIEIAVRFACPALLPDTCGVYGQPMLPRMHYLQPLGVAQQEALRGAAAKMVAAWLARSEPPLGPEVVRYMLDADSHAWSMRKSKANWFRIVAVLAWLVGLAKWLDDIRQWRNQVTTVLVHILYLVLVWYPDLIVPTGFLYVFLIGIWYYRFRPKIPAGMDTRLSQAESVDPDELDEEFDTLPSSKPPELIRVRYDRLRIIAARVQTVLGDFAAQGERVQALVSWRDPRATKLFIVVCLLITITLYTVPPKMVAVALGFYFLRHPMFRDPMPPASLNFFRRLPSLSDRLI